MNYPATDLRDIIRMGTMIISPHPALSHKGRGDTVAPKQSFEESIE